LGVALDDQEGRSVIIRTLSTVPYMLEILPDGKALVKLVSPAQLIKAREEKRAILEEKTAKKAAAVEAERQKRQQKIEKGRVSPKDMFKPPHVPQGKYSSWDESGIPLTDGDGKELSKNQTKRVQKDHADQAKLHEEFLAWQKQKDGK
jgi:cysteinyl-tRNA synthetase